MKKNMYSVLLHFFLFVCLVIPLHTTANAANTTDDCLQILTSDFNSNSAQEFIGTQHLNITDSQYQTIRTFTLDLTEKYSSTKDKITAIYQWARDTSLKASVGESAPADLEENDPYKVFKEKTGVCQGKTNLCKTMLAAIDVPCISPTATGKPKAMHGISFCVTANGASSMHPCGRSRWMILPTSLLIIKQTAWKLFFMKRTALNLLTIWAALCCRLYRKCGASGNPEKLQ